jgi:hypothetical protein
MLDQTDGVNVRSPAIAWHEQAFQLAQWAWERLANRFDAWGEYRPSEEVGKPWEKDGRKGVLGEQKTAKGKLTQARLMRHFKATGRTDVVGLHTAGADNQSKGGGLDIDWHVDGEPAPEANLAAALAWYVRLVRLGFRPLLYESNGRGGYHLRVLLLRAVPADGLFWFLRDLTSDHARHGLDAPPEQFPKQSDVRQCKGGFGNWLRVVGRHHRRDFWPRVWDGNAWLEGAAAVAHILSLTGDDPALIPPHCEGRYRGRAYLRTVPNLAEGKGRNDAAFPAFCFLVRDLALPDGIAMELMGEWDAGNSPPLGPGELAECLRNAHDYGRHAYGAGLGGAVPAPPAPPPGPLPPGQASEGDGQAGPFRINVFVSNNERAVNDKVAACLTAEEGLYQHAELLVRVLRDQRATELTGITRQPNSPRIDPVQLPTLREIVSSHVCFLRHGGPDEPPKKVHPPKWSYEAIARRGHWSGIPHLEGVVEMPTLLPNGTILDRPGLDRATGLLYEPNADFPPVPENPTWEFVGRAAEMLLDLVSDFPFDKPEDGRPVHQAAWLAALLTPMARFAIRGPTPLFAFDGTTPGCGKGLLVQVISLINTGRHANLMAYCDDDAEMRKRITAVVLGGDRMILLDNVAGQLGGPALDALLTSPTWNDRILGVSKLTTSLPVLTVWYATGNNLQLVGDVARRVLPCRLVSDEENPEIRVEFKYPNLADHVLANRPALVVAALTILRGYAAAGRPVQKGLHFGSFESWSRVVRDAVLWALLGQVDPCATRQGMPAAAGRSETLHDLVHGWAELPGARGEGLTVVEALRLLEDPNYATDFERLRVAILDLVAGRVMNTANVGYLLRSVRDRVFGSLRLVKSGQDYGTNRWKVVTIGQCSPSASESSGSS